MTVDELGHKELELYSRVISIHGTMEEKYEEIKKQNIFEEYKKIHQEYAKVNKSNLEALKRALFLIWYSRLEPACYSGVSMLDLDAEKKVIHTLDRRLSKNVTDYELDWMLDYYSNWAFLFDDFKEYHNFYSRLHTRKTEMPNSIDKKEMEVRGQMGIYWNSLTLNSE
jgi:hypothetical protein